MAPKKSREMNDGNSTGSRILLFLETVEAGFPWVVATRPPGLISGNEHIYGCLLLLVTCLMHYIINNTLYS